MKIVTIFLISFFALVLACKEKTTIPENNNTLTGKWSLIKFETGWSKEYFNKNDILWEFKQDSTLSVIINTTLTKSGIPIQGNGSYPYSINGERITIKNITYEIEGEKITIESITYEYTIQDGLLILFYQVDSDGPRIEFERVN